MIFTPGYLKDDGENLFLGDPLPYDNLLTSSPACL
jgi:hypothetical protein